MNVSSEPLQRLQQKVKLLDMNKKFKVIAMGRVGTLAINRFINDHPQISLPSYKESTKLFTSTKKNIAELFILDDERLTNRGIIIHDAAFLDIKYRKALVKMNNIKVQNIIHLVRNPFEQVLSWINHINASAAIGVSKFNSISASASSFEKVYPRHFKTIFSGLQCKTFYKNATNINVVDFRSLLSENVDKTMEGIYEFLGVDRTYTSEMFHKAQNNYTRELMSKGIEFKLNNEVIEMGIMPQDLFFHHIKDAEPWVTIHDTDKVFSHCPTLPKLEGDLIFLPKDYAAVNQLSFKTRKMLHEGIADIVSQVVPVWAQNAEKIAQKIENEKLVKLTDADKDFVAKATKDDLDIFYRYYPDFKSTWDA